MALALRRHWDYTLRRHWDVWYVYQTCLGTTHNYSQELVELQKKPLTMFWTGIYFLVGQHYTIIHILCMSK